MIYLKIFHKFILLFFILLTAGCASSLNSGVNAEIVDERETVLINNDHIIKEPVEVDPVSEVDPVEIDNPSENIEWTVPEVENISPLFFIPEVPLQESTIPENKIEELLYVSPLFDNYDLGWDQVNDFGSKKETEVKIKTEIIVESIPEKEQNQEENLDNSIIKRNEITKTILTEREISAPPLDKLDITLNGIGWIYLPDQENLDIEYNGRKFTNENTVYTFVPKAEGYYLLRFQFQNLTDNIYTVEKINLRITKEQLNNESDDVHGNTEIEDSLIVSNMDLETSISIMLEEGNGEGISDKVSELLSSKDSSIKKMLPELAEFLYNSSYYTSASLILEKLIEDNAFISRSDYFLYLLGKIYEEDSQIRNELISANYYKMLIDGYPASIYWEESRDRYRFLKRRYIDIR